MFIEIMISSLKSAELWRTAFPTVSVLFHSIAQPPRHVAIMEELDLYTVKFLHYHDKNNASI